MKKHITIILFIIIFSNNTFGQFWNNKYKNVMSQRDNFYLLCYIKTKPIIKTKVDTSWFVNKTGDYGPRYEGLKSNEVMLQFKALIVDAYSCYTFYRSLQISQKNKNDTIFPTHVKYPYQKVLDVGIVFNKRDKRKMKKIMKLYTKKRLFIISGLFYPIKQHIIVKNIGLYVTDVGIYKIVFLEDINVKIFDVLYHLEVEESNQE